MERTGGCVVILVFSVFVYTRAQTDPCAGRKPVVQKLKDDLVNCSVPLQDKIHTIGCRFVLKSGMNCYLKYEDGTECEEPLGISWQEGVLECEIENRLIPPILNVKRKSSTQDNKTSSSTAATPPSEAAKDNCSTLTVSHESLLVEYGKPVELNCSISSKPPSSQYILGWEAQINPVQTDSETSVVWRSSSLTEWEVNGRELFCYLTVTVGQSEEQCKKFVHLNLYKRPDSMKISSESSVWSEGQMMNLTCEIKNVGPLQSLTVQWTRVDQSKNRTVTEMSYGSFSSSGEERKSGNVTATREVSASRDEDGVQYQCAALLKLEQLQQPQVGKSEPLKISVHYKPTITQPSNGTVSVTTGDRLVLNCSAHGNPSPQYSWSSPGNMNLINSSILIISSVQSEDQGQYSCTAYNDEGSVSVTVTVNVVEDYLLIIIVCAVLCLVLLVAVVSFFYCKYYRHTHMGHYILKNLTSRRHNGNVAHSDTDQSQL